MEGNKDKELQSILADLNDDEENVETFNRSKKKLIYYPFRLF